MNDSKVAPVEAQAVPDQPVARVFLQSSNGSAGVMWLNGYQPKVDDELFTRPTPAAADLTKERVTFEAWADAQGFPLRRLDVFDGESYADLRTQGVWEAWQARAFTRPARFDKTSCSQCGSEFGPGDEGFSHCEDHAASPAAAAGVPTFQSIMELVEEFGLTCRLAGVKQAKGDPRAELNAAIFTCAESIRKAIRSLASPVAPVGAPTARMLTEQERSEVIAQRLANFDATENIAVMLQRKFCEVNGISLLSAQGCELATDATKQQRAQARMPTDADLERWANSWNASAGEFIEHLLREFCKSNSIHLAVNDAEEDFRMRPASSEAAPSGEGME